MLVVLGYADSKTKYLLF